MPAAATQLININVIGAWALQTAAQSGFDIGLLKACKTFRG
jgi:hypothetical protein